MRRIAFGFAVCAGVLFAAVPRAQDRARVVPITAPRAIPPDNALIFTHQNELNPSTGACTSPGRVLRIREVSDTGWERGPSVAGLSLDIPAGVTLDSSGRLYIADRENRRPRRCIGSGENVVSVASYWEVVIKTQKGLLTIADVAQGSV